MENERMEIWKMVQRMSTEQVAQLLKNFEIAKSAEVAEERRTPAR